MRGDGKYAKLNPHKDPGRALNSMEAAHLLARHGDAFHKLPGLCGPGLRKVRTRVRTVPGLPKLSQPWAPFGAMNGPAEFHLRFLSVFLTWRVAV